MSLVVAVDGPAGSGKGTITKLVAEKLKLVYIDTGAMYRCVTLECLNNKIKPTDIEKINKILEEIEIELRVENEQQKVYLNKEDVTLKIRTPEVDKIVSKFSEIKEVRDKITPIQQRMGENNNIIMEGRDIGTTVFPNANVKIYLDASPEERAMRRVKQNQEKGLKMSYEEALENVKTRDRIDSERKISPLTKAKDAIYIDSTNMTIDEVVEKMIKIIEEIR